MTVCGCSTHPAHVIATAQHFMVLMRDAARYRVMVQLSSFGGKPFLETFSFHSLLLHSLLVILMNLVHANGVLGLFPYLEVHYALKKCAAQKRFICHNY